MAFFCSGIWSTLIDSPRRRAVANMGGPLLLQSLLINLALGYYPFSLLYTAAVPACCCCSGATCPSDKALLGICSLVAACCTALAGLARRTLIRCWRCTPQYGRVGESDHLPWYNYRPDFILRWVLLRASPPKEEVKSRAGITSICLLEI